MPYGFVYIGYSASMPGLYKIGSTTIAPMERMRQLSSSTSVPTRFILLAYCQVEGPMALEKECHAMFAEFRVRDGREFFRMNFATLELVCEHLEGSGDTAWVSPADIYCIRADELYSEQGAK